MNMWGADTPVREMSTEKRNLAWLSEVRQKVFGSWALFMAAVREIFEESAYERFLARTHMQSSPAAYSDFLRETETAKARPPKCC